MNKDYIELNKSKENLCYTCNDEYSDTPCDPSDCFIIRVLNEQPIANVVEIPETGIGDLSDGYHTFNELYHHRAVLFSVICNMFPEKAWKSKFHDTGDMFDGMFIVGIETPEGQATYHYDLNPYWDMFKVKELDKAPTWDGHTPEDAINRISKLGNKEATWRLETDEEEPNPMFKLVVCSNCNNKANTNYNFCPDCGATMTGLTTEGVKGVKLS